MQLDDPVDRFGAAVGGPVGGEVAQELLTPAAQGPAQAGDLGDRAGVERLKDPFGDLLAGGQVWRVVGRAQLLVALPGDQDLVVGVAVLQAGGQSVPLAGGEVFGAAAQQVADPEQRVPGVAAVAQGVLLDVSRVRLSGRARCLWA